MRGGNEEVEKGEEVNWREGEETEPLVPKIFDLWSQSPSRGLNLGDLFLILETRSQSWRRGPNLQVAVAVPTAVTKTATTMTAMTMTVLRMTITPKTIIAMTMMARTVTAMGQWGINHLEKRLRKMPIFLGCF